MLKLHLLGRFDIQANDRPVTIPSRKAQSLLAYLVMNLGANHRREKVAGLLWLESEESDARRKLRYALWQLREKLGDAYFLTDRIHVGFNQESDFWLDVAQLKPGMAGEMATDELLSMVAVYDGELLPGFYEDWVIRERDRLQSIFEQIMLTLLDRLVEERRWPEILMPAERWIALGNAPEPAFRALMVAHSRLGNISQAAQAYERCVVTMKDLLEVDPSAETQQLYRVISRGEMPVSGTPSNKVSGDVSGTPSGKAVTKSPPFLRLEEARHRERITLFVARERELAQLDQQLEMALEDHGRVVFISGDAGRGKSTLLGEFSRRALQRDGRLVTALGNCEAHFGLGDPHLPFRDVLALLTGDLEPAWSRGLLSREAVARLWNLVPTSTSAVVELGPDLIDSFIPGEVIQARGMAYAPGGAEWLERLAAQVDLRQTRPSPINVQHADSQKALFEQYTRVLQRLAQSYPLLVILDDLQWADPGTVSLLFHLGRRLEGHRILIAGAYRPDELAQSQDGQLHPLFEALTEFKRYFGRVVIDLDQEDEVEGRHFVDALLDTESNKLGEDFRRAFYRHTGGHPLFSVELLRQMQLQGDLKKNELGQWIIGRNLGWDRLPARVEAVIAGRINRLPENLKGILRAACVEGEEFTAEVISRVTGRGTLAVIETLSHELEQQYLLVEAGVVRWIGQQHLSFYRFKHHLYQRYIYHSLDKVERVHLHEAVGEALEALYARRTDLVAVRLAHHFEKAGLAEKAVDYLLSAGHLAKRQSANKEAIAHLTRGLKLLGSLPVTADRDQRELALQMALAAPLVATRGYTAPEAEQAYERARSLCEQMGDEPQLAHALWGLWSFYLVRGRHTTARGLAEQIFSIARLTGNADLLLVSHWTLGISLIHLGDIVKAQEHLDQAIDSYDPGRHLQLTYLYGQNPAVTCLVYSAVNLWALGYPDRANERCQRSLQLAEDIEHPYSLTFAHGMAAIFHGVRREPEAALHHAQQAASLAKEAGFPFLLALALTMRGWARAALGKQSMTLNQIQGGIEAMDRIGADLGRPIFSFFLADAALKTGRIEEGLDAIGEALRFVEKNGERLYESDMHRLRGDLLARQGGSGADSVANYHRAIDSARRQQAKTMELRALVALSNYWLARGQGSTVHRELAGLYAWFEQGMDTPDLLEARHILRQDK